MTTREQAIKNIEAFVEARAKVNPLDYIISADTRGPHLLLSDLRAVVDPAPVGRFEVVADLEVFLDVCGLGPDDIDECIHDTSPGKTICGLYDLLESAITGPAGYTILLNALIYDDDADMVLVRVSLPGPGTKCLCTYAVDWDDIAPRDLAPRDLPGLPITVDTARQVLQGIANEANRAIHT